MEDTTKKEINKILKLELLLMEAEEDYFRKEKYYDSEVLLQIKNLIKRIENKIDRSWDKLLTNLGIKSISKIPTDIYDYFNKGKCNLVVNPNHNYKESFQLIMMTK